MVTAEEPKVADKFAVKVDVFAAIPEAPKGKGGSKTPVVSIPPELEARLQERAGIKAALADTKAYLDLMEDELVPQCEALRRNLSQQQQRHAPSISLAGKVTYEVQNKYSGVPLGGEEEAKLRRLFNGRFEELFKTETKLKVDADKFRALAESNPVVAQALQVLVREGAVVRTTVLKPTDTLHFARSTDPNMGVLADNAAREYAGLKPSMFFTK